MESLSAREQEVLALVSHGKSNREIADALFIGTETVKSHLSAIYRKLGVAGRHEAAVVALTAAHHGREVDLVQAIA